MHECAVSHDAYNPLYDFAVRWRIFLIGGFAAGLALFQGRYSAANYLPIPVLPQQYPF
jgi:hypothetical protein